MTERKPARVRFADRCQWWPMCWITDQGTPLSTESMVLAGPDYVAPITASIATTFAIVKALQSAGLRVPERHK